MEDRELFFKKLVSDYSERVYWHIRSLVGSHEDADDILQDVFIKAWKALPSFRGDSSSFTWLWRIATNESLNFLRYRRVRAALRFESLDTCQDVSSDSFFDGDKAEASLAEAVSSLPPKQRSVFCMRYYEDLSYEDISEITGTSVGALKASYHIASEKIKNRLSEKF